MTDRLLPAGDGPTPLSAEDAEALVPTDIATRFDRDEGQPYDDARTWGTQPAPAFRADVHGLRGLAICLVVSFHISSAFAPGGFLGVDAFFVISGFVNARLLLGELRDTGRVDIADFYARRVRRLLPALAVLLLFVVAFGLPFLSPVDVAEATGMSVLTTVGFVTNMGLFIKNLGYFDAYVDLLPLRHMWSLAVEGQIYVVLPVLMLGVWRLGGRFRHRQRATVGVLALLVATSFIFAMLVSRIDGRLAFYGAPTRAWEFLAGGLVAALPRAPRWRNERVQTACAGTALSAILWSALSGNAFDPFPGVATSSVVAAVLVIASCSVQRGWAYRVLTNTALVRLGDISYGWYLWHWPMIVFAKTVWPSNTTAVLLAAALSIGPAVLSRQLIEVPIQKMRHLRGRRLLPLASAATLLPALAALVLIAGFDTRIAPREIRALRAQLIQHADRTRGCSNGPSLDQAFLHCRWQIPNSQGEVVLVGDSNAGQFTEPMHAAARLNRQSMTVATMSACPFSTTPVRFALIDASACHRFALKTIRDLVRVRPSLVVIASASIEYVRPNNGVAFVSTNGKLIRDEKGKARLWAQGLREATTTLVAAGIPVAIIHSIPRFPTFDLRTCPTVRLLSRPGSCGQTRPRSTAEKEQAVALDAEQRALAGLPLARGFDVTPYLCTDTCTTNIGRTWRYRDAAHLTVGGAKSLTLPFAQLVREMSRIRFARS